MKNWIQERHEEERLSYDRLREAVKAAWNAIPQTRLVELMGSINAICQAIIDANGQQILESRLEVIYEYFDSLLLSSTTATGCSMYCPWPVTHSIAAASTLPKVY